jgi:hypothetical protein
LTRVNNKITSFQLQREYWILVCRRVKWVETVLFACVLTLLHQLPLSLACLLDPCGRVGNPSTPVMRVRHFGGIFCFSCVIQMMPPLHFPSCSKIPAKWGKGTAVKFVEIYREQECLWDLSAPSTEKASTRTCTTENMEEMGMSEFGTWEAEQKVNFRPTYSQEQ